MSRLFVLFSLLLFTPLLMAGEDAIQAMRLSEALSAFARNSGLQVVYVTDVTDGLRTNGAPAGLEPKQTLEALLEGTGLTYRFVNKKTVTIEAGKKKQSAAMSGSKDGSITEGMQLAQTDEAARSDSASNAQEATNNQTTQNSGSSAGESDHKLQEIVVTAQRREERTIDVPMSITAISGDKLSAAGINNALDLSFAVPGLSVTEMGPGRQIVAIRGIASIRGNSSLTGVYLDEMPITGAQDGLIATSNADIRMLDLERVEVLKGPQGTLFGEGSAGGVIRYITKDPDTDQLGGSASFELTDTADGGWGEKIEGVLNVPLAPDVLGIRVAALYQNASGWIDMPGGVPAQISPDTGEPFSPPSIARSDINDSEVKHARVKALYTPTAELRIKALAEIHRNDIGAANAVNLLPFEEGNFLQGPNRLESTAATDDYDMFNLTASYDFGFGQLLSSTSYAKLDSVQSFTQLTEEQPYPYLEQAIPTFEQDASIKSQEFRFTSADEGPFSWTTGALYKESSIRTGFGSAGIDLLGFGGAFVLRGLGAGNATQIEGETWAAFADASYEFANRIELGGGLRFLSDERESFDPNAVVREVISSDANKTTFRAFIKYAFSQDANAYFNVGTGYRAGAPLGTFAREQGAPDSYGPENTIFYELGTKLSLLNGRVRANAAVFYGEYRDMLADKHIRSPVTGGDVQFTANGQDSEVRGVEWDIGWVATERLTLTLAGGVTDTEINKVEPNPVSPVYFLGDPISLVPKYNISASADYRFQWANSIPGFVLLNFDRKGKTYWTERVNFLQLDQQYVSPEVNFLSASVGAEWGGWRWSLLGRNLTNERDPINPSLSGWTAQARPRTVGVAVSKQF